MLQCILWVNIPFQPIKTIYFPEQQLPVHSTSHKAQFGNTELVELVSRKNLKNDFGFIHWN